MSSVCSIMPFLQKGYTIPDLVQNFAQELRKEGSLQSILHANKLMEYHKMITTSNFLENLQNNFKYIQRICNELDFLYSIDGRRKALQSFEDKIAHLLNSSSSLDLLRDIYAFRLIIHDAPQNPMDAIANCYVAMEKIILYLSSQGFIPCESKISSQKEKFNPTKHPEIYVPTKPCLNPKFKDYVKNYIYRPKSNGYQSLHASFRDSRTGRFFEVQIRTATMHIHAEYFGAKHLDYKKKKYSATTQTWDWSKINVSGFYYIPPHDEEKESYLDLAGLIEPKIILQ